MRQKIDTDIQEIWNPSIIQATDNKSHDDQPSPSILKENQRADQDYNKNSQKSEKLMQFDQAQENSSEDLDTMQQEQFTSPHSSMKRVIASIEEGNS